MAKYWLIAFLAIFELVLFIGAAPRSLDAEQIGNLSAIADIEQPVRYDGAQLWSVDFSDDRTKLVVVNLKKNFGLYFIWSKFYRGEKKKKNQSDTVWSQTTHEHFFPTTMLVNFITINYQTENYKKILHLYEKL